MHARRMPGAIVTPCINSTKTEPCDVKLKDSNGSMQHAPHAVVEGFTCTHLQQRVYRVPCALWLYTNATTHPTLVARAGGPMLVQTLPA